MDTDKEKKMGFFDGGLGAVGGIIQALTSIGSAKRQADRQKEVMAYQDKLQDENYQRELADKERLIAEDREYTSIGAQMQRARDAGVSPLAALGASQGNSISASSPASGAVSIPGVAPDSLQQVGQGLASSINGALDAQIKQEQVKQMKLQNEYDSKTLGYRTELSRLAAEGQEQLNKLNAVMTDKTEKESNLTTAMESYYKALANRTERLTGAELDNLRAQYDKIMAETTELDIKNSQLRELMDAQIYNLQVATWAALQQGNVFRQQGKYIGYDAYTRRMDAETKQKANELTKEFNDIQKKAQEADQAYKEALAEYNAGRLSQEKVEARRRFWLDTTKAVIDTGFKCAAAYATGGMALPFLSGSTPVSSPFTTSSTGGNFVY